MHNELKEIPDRILHVAIGALMQANRHAVFYDPGMDHWTNMGILNAALAGELFLKAVIAKEHPLLIFRDLFQLNDDNNEELSIDHIIRKGKTYGFESLAKLLWVTTGERLPDMESFEKLRKARNSIQHFCVPSEGEDLRSISLRFLYNNIDPLIYKHFNIYAIEHHEDHVGYDYVVKCLIMNNLLFSIPDDFSVGEIDLKETLADRPKKYQQEFMKRLQQKGVEL